MDFEFSQDQELLRENVRRYLEENAPLSPYVREQIEADRGVSDAVWKGLAELGLLGILIPEEYGGAGLGMLEMGVVLEEMGRLVHPGPYLGTALEAVSLIRAAASEADCGALLRAIATGEAVVGVALFEPDGLDAWREPQTIATREGDDWSITGTKTFVADGGAADHFLVTARAEGAPGLFEVEASARGVTCKTDPTMDGTRKQATLVLESARARRIAAHAIESAVATMLDRTIIGWVVDGVGAAARALELSIAYAKERIQFGVPIGSFQAVQHMLAEMLQELELGRAAAYYALWAADATDAAERHRAATMAKAHASDAFAKIGADAIQVFGGVGFTWEYDIHFYYKRLLSLQHAFGGSSDHLEELAKIVLDSPTP